MKKIIALFFSMAVMVLYANNLTAQQKPTTTVTSVAQKGENIWFTLTSSQPLIFGDNRYVLYIDGREFVKSNTPQDEDNKVVSFLLSADELNSLKEGSGIYLSYGHLKIEYQDMEALSQQSRRCWSVGKFTKAMLK
ncbi:MAG: hypothetical protein K0Q79_914 [Flavipsychrobacter sp.]|jgi:hypothetical protein|nr:hypothetical protein [Flavipsychrobacter sp.]